MSNKIRCSHCNLEFNKEVMIEDGSEFFCCNGCQGVYHLLQDDGLDSFYEKVGKNSLEPPKALGEDSSNFDMESFKNRYIKTTPDGFSQVDLIIEGIHCAACIWLNEKVLHKTEGIIEASINFTNYKAKIIWDEDVIPLSKVIDKIRSIGYNAYPYDRSESEKKATQNQKDFFLRMSIAIFASVNIMMIGVAKYTGFFTGMEEDVLRLVHMAEFIFATPVLFYSGWVFYKGAYYGLKNKILNMDFLVSSGATLTYIYSLYVLLGGSGHSYFDSVAMIITFVLVGKYLEVIGKKSAVDTMDTIKSQVPIEATIIENGVKKIVPVENVKVGDTIEVKHGEKASVDGEIISGESSFDESSITGESLPVSKFQGDTIYSGTINTDKVIRYSAQKDYAHSTLNTIVELIEDALNSKPKIEETTNEISKYFSVTIITIALLSFIAWYLYNSDFENALIITISVIVIACPCALALATPIASLIGINELSKKGILFKEAKLIETFCNIDTVVLDKTGTLTTGKLTVTKAQLPKTKEDTLLLYSLVDSSNHPISKAIKSYLQERICDLENIALESVEQIPAKGIQAFHNTRKLFGGKSQNETQSSTFDFFIDENRLAFFELEDSIKEQSHELIEYLTAHNITPIICSGDHDAVVKKIAQELGVTQYYSNMTPTQKSHLVSELKKQNKKVLMAGDGVNDALALSKSDISIAMGNGADIAIAVSDVVLLHDSIENIKNAFILSKRTYGFIKQNLTISLIYNLITIPIAVAGYVIPLVAALSMSVSSLLVVGNSIRIKKGKKKNG